MRSQLAACFGACVVLAGCGGGGGGGGGGSSQSQERFTVDRQQIGVGVSSTATSAPPISLTGTISGSPSTIYAVIEHTTNGLTNVTVPVLSGNSATSTVQFKSPQTVGPGTYQDTITIRACRDAQCTQQFAGSPVTVAVTYKVGVQVAPAPISIQGVEGKATVLNVSLDNYAPTAQWSTSITYTNGSGWLVAQPASGTALPVTTALNASALVAGRYAGQLTISATPTLARAEQRTVPVIYVVEPLLASAAVTPFTVTPTQAANGQLRDIAITSRDPNRLPQWSAAASAPWLRVTTPTGSTATSQTLRVELETSALARLPNGTYDATVVVTPQLAGMTPIDVPVQLILNRPHIDAIAPYVEKANVKREVYLGGSRLTDAPITSVHFGAYAAVSYTVQSGTRIVATHPPLAAGRYPIEARTEGGVIESGAELVVMGSSSYAATSNQAAPHYGTTSFFDKERDSCYTGSSPEASIVALRKNGSTWDVQESAATYANVSAIRATADGRELLVFIGANTIVHLDPVTLAELRRSTTSSDALGSNNGYPMNGVVVTDNGTVLVARGASFVRYQPANGTFAIAGPGADPSFWGAASAAGNRFAWTHPSSLQPADYALVETSSLQSTHLYASIGSLSDIEGGRFGTRWAFAGETSHSQLAVTIVDAGGGVRGTIPGSMSRGPIVMTPDGNTLYVGVGNDIEVFDLSVVPADGTYESSSTIPLEMPVDSLTYGSDPVLSANEDALIDCSPNGVTAIALP